MGTGGNSNTLDQKRGPKPSIDPETHIRHRYHLYFFWGPSARPRGHATSSDDPLGRSLGFTIPGGKRRNDNLILVSVFVSGP